ncbi:MAG: hypothetical protein OJJ55_19050 [Rhodococcus sp.]|nr:hypothetical protein [Rhodococcus sp. (in: high G+C Gram-positive bacteria)]
MSTETPTVADAAAARIKEKKKDEEPSPSEEHGNIGEAIYAEVEALTKGGKITRSQAFDEIATRSGRKVGTVSANYYRVARAKGEGRPIPARTQAGPRRSGGTVADQVRAMEQELEELRAWKARVESLLK